MARSDWRVGLPVRPSSIETPKRTVVARAPEEIPRIVHQVFGLWDGDAPLPKQFERDSTSWRTRHPNWKYVLWRRQAVEALLAQAPAAVRSAYAAFGRGIQRADLARYLILQQHGGVYADLDVTCLKPLGPLLASNAGARALLFVEGVQSAEAARHRGNVQPIRRGVPEVTTRVANYVMATAPRAPLMERIVSLLVERAALDVKTDYDVLYTTGPDVVSEAVHAEHAAPDCKLVPPLVARLYFRHRCAGTWRGARDHAPIED
jgi:mannosyltransferase OCH1-like enzyme